MRRRLEAYYFPEQKNLYKIPFGASKINSSFMQFYNDGKFVTNWNNDELAKSYDLEATIERLKTF